MLNYSFPYLSSISKWWESNGWLARCSLNTIAWSIMIIHAQNLPYNYYLRTYYQRGQFMAKQISYIGILTASSYSIPQNPELSSWGLARSLGGGLFNLWARGVLVRIAGSIRLMLRRRNKSNINGKYVIQTELLLLRTFLCWCWLRSSFFSLFDGKKERVSSMS